MKTYNQTNFFKHTFCEFDLIDTFEFPENTNYKSKSESIYFYTDEGVYRKSNHWGRVANCRWKITTNENYKNQQIVIGFAKWSDFYPISSSEKLFFIAVNFDKRTAKIQSGTKDSTNHLFTFSEAQKRIKQSTHLLNEDKWTRYFEASIKDIKFKIISDFINSDKTLQEIKKCYK
ncbi:hypothetical protein [Polaribacter glomeratus]|uniref:Uncharacterized protein n=1 Tax=Polaribacter glomeratus TaxID=102 RepID=A0A2S7WY34_9FLAO|nr:hypothetical protein [Polaribacter glomeratus]PQJ82483.1 hypothetical protein BTO16_07790 [Polaribacter glomeratus]TXD64278.1 hypothetical protein ESX12_15300 [Polaribacter glomeratus]